MIKVLFVCLGNICRSPMAEFVMKDLVKKQGLETEFQIESAATSSEEVGNGIHYETMAKLKEKQISYGDKKARKLTKEDYEKFNYILGMETSNIRNIYRIIGEDNKNKVYRLLDFSQNPHDIADPWYTGNFEVTFEDVLEGCQAFLEFVKKEMK